MAYIEFGDEDAMKAGFAKHAEVRPYLYLSCVTKRLIDICLIETQRCHTRSQTGY